MRRLVVLVRMRISRRKRVYTCHDVRVPNPACNQHHVSFSQQSTDVSVYEVRQKNDPQDLQPISLLISRVTAQKCFVTELAIIHVTVSFRYAPDCARCQFTGHIVCIGAQPRGRVDCISHMWDDGRSVSGDGSWCLRSDHRRSKRMLIGFLAIQAHPLVRNCGSKRWPWPMRLPTPASTSRIQHDFTSKSRPLQRLSEGYIDALLHAGGPGAQVRPDRERLNCSRFARVRECAFRNTETLRDVIVESFACVVIASSCAS